MERPANIERGLNKGRSELLKKGWLRLYDVFLRFHDAGYEIKGNGTFLKPEGKIIQTDSADSVRKELSEEGETAVNFRYFQIGICRADKLSCFNQNVVSLYDFCFFLIFTRYRDNQKLLAEIEKLGKLTSFSIRKIDESLYALDLKHE